MTFCEKFPFELLSCAPGIADARTPTFERHDYQYCSMEYIVRGHGVLETAAGRSECGPGDVYFLHRHRDHRYWPDRRDPWAKLFFVVDGALADELWRIYGLTDLDAIHEAQALEKYFQAFFHLRFSEGRDRQAAVIFHQLAEHASRIAFAPPETIPPEIAALRRELEQNANAPFRLEDFSAGRQYSVAWMIRNFSKHYGCTPGEYRMRLRIDTAERLLLHSDLSIKEIAGTLGFSDQYNFSRCFKQRTGHSPSECRKK